MAAKPPVSSVDAALFAARLEVNRETWVDLPTLHPLAAAGDRAVQHIAWWLELLCWQLGLCGIGEGVSFVELALDFLLRAASQSPQWSGREGWTSPALEDVCTVNMRCASWTLATMFRWLIVAGCVPVQVRCMRVEILAKAMR